MTSTISALLRTALVDVARLRLGLPRGEPAEVRPFYPDEIDHCWVVPLFDGDQGRVLVMMTRDGEVAAHAGLPRAAARLREMGALARNPVWAATNIRPILDAVGGLTPGYPRYPSEVTERGADGGIRLILDEPESWVRYAAGGGRGAPPAEGRSGGVRPPEARGRMVCDLAPDYDITWTYLLDDTPVGSFAGHADEDRPDQAPALLAETVLAAARRQVASPLAMPAAPVARKGDGPATETWQVDLLGLGEVIVNTPREV